MPKPSWSVIVSCSCTLHSNQRPRYQRAAQIRWFLALVQQLCHVTQRIAWVTDRFCQINSDRRAPAGLARPRSETLRLQSYCHRICHSVNTNLQYSLGHSAGSKFTEKLRRVRGLEGCSVGMQKDLGFLKRTHGSSLFRPYRASSSRPSRRCQLCRAELASSMPRNVRPSLGKMQETKPHRRQKTRFKRLEHTNCCLS